MYSWFQYLLLVWRPSVHLNDLMARSSRTEPYLTSLTKLKFQFSNLVPTFLVRPADVY